MKFVGIDSGVYNCVAVILNTDTGKSEEVTFSTTKESIKAFAEKILTKDMVIGIEASVNTFYLANQLKPYVDKVIVVVPEKQKDGIKTDKRDAERIAKSLAMGTYKPCWLPPLPIGELRCVMHHIYNLTKDGARARNRVRAFLWREGIILKSKDLSTKKGEEEINEILRNLPQHKAKILSDYLDDWQRAKEKLQDKENELLELAKDDYFVQLLMTVYGINVRSAFYILAEIGDIFRFPSPRQLARYAGLVPTVQQSGKHCYTGRITKAGRKVLRWVMVQIANNAIRQEGPLRDFYLKLANRKGHNKAIVACARKLLCIIWHMLTRGEIYRNCDTELYNKKIRKIKKVAKKEKSDWEISLPELLSKLKDFIESEEPSSVMGCPKAIARLMKKI
ncbi:MAG: IS110 family transposase [bacterium]